MRKILLLMMLLTMTFQACHGKADREQQVPKDTITTFILPQIPVMFTEPGQRLDFFLQHYWDNINLADTNYVHHPEITEQAWADYVNLLPQLGQPAKVDAYLKALMRKARLNGIRRHGRRRPEQIGARGS